MTDKTNCTECGHPISEHCDESGCTHRIESECKDCTCERTISSFVNVLACEVSAIAAERDAANKRYDEIADWLREKTEQCDNVINERDAAFTDNERLRDENKTLLVRAASERKMHKEAADARDVLQQRLVNIADKDPGFTVGTTGLGNQYYYVDAGGMTNIALTNALLAAQAKIVILESASKELTSLLDSKEGELQTALAELGRIKQGTVIYAIASDKQAFDVAKFLANSNCEFELHAVTPCKEVKEE